MKIIAKDNLDRDTVAEELIADSIKDAGFATTMAQALNDKYCTHDLSPWYYVVRQDDYRLWAGMENLV